jgi:hypothetical protein
MNKTGRLLFFIAFVYDCAVFAQSNQDVNNIQPVQERIFSGMSIGLVSHLSTVDGGIAFITGPELDFQFDKQLILGLRISASVNPLVIQGFDGSDIRMYNAGLNMAYILLPGKKIHPVAGIYAGYGYVFIDDSYLTIYEFNPSLVFEMNCSERFKAGIGAGFRINNPLDIYNTKYAYISAPEILFQLSYCLK